MAVVKLDKKNGNSFFGAFILCLLIFHLANSIYPLTSVFWTRVRWRPVSWDFWESFSSRPRFEERAKSAGWWLPMRRWGKLAASSVRVIERLDGRTKSLDRRTHFYETVRWARTNTDKLAQKEPTERDHELKFEKSDLRQTANLINFLRAPRKAKYKTEMVQSKMVALFLYRVPGC